MFLMIQGIRFQVQVLKPCKSVQETSEKVLDFKTRQLVLSRFKRLFKLDARQLLDRYVICQGLWKSVF